MLLLPRESQNQRVLWISGLNRTADAHVPPDVNRPARGWQRVWKEMPYTQPHFPRGAPALHHQRTIWKQSRAAAFINKLFIVRKWLGQRLNINPNQKHTQQNQCRPCEVSPGPGMQRSTERAPNSERVAEAGTWEFHMCCGSVLLQLTAPFTPASKGETVQ